MTIRIVLARVDGRVQITHDDRYMETQHPDGSVIVERAGERIGARVGELVGYTADGLKARLSPAESEALKTADSEAARAVQAKLDAGEPVTREEIAAIRDAGLVGDVTARKPPAKDDETKGRQ